VEELIVEQVREWATRAEDVDLREMKREAREKVEEAFQATVE
jgi:hypothetical protein